MTFLRLLYARAGVAYSYATGSKMVKYTDEQILELLQRDFAGRRVLLLAPVVKGRKGHYRELFENLRKNGFISARVDGELREITIGMSVDRYKMHDIEIENVEINDADEVFWRCRNLNIKNLKLHGGTYPFMFSSNIRIDGLESDSKYVFQYVKDVEIHNAKITTKDAFWEVENVTIYDSELNGEYLGWHSHNLRLVNCHITGEQPLCYAHDLVLENCTFGPDCDRAFEYSSVQATIKGAIGGVKNPRTGCITAESYGEIILDENIKAPADCKLRLWDEKTCFTD